MLVHLLVVVIVLAVLVWIVDRAGVQPPVRWVLYALLAVIALVVLLPFLGLHLGA